MMMAILLIAVACAPEQPRTAAPGAGIVRQDLQPAAAGGGSGNAAELDAARAAQAAAGGSAADKTLVIGIAAEVVGFSSMNGVQNKYVDDLVSGNLMLQDEQGRWFPALITERPSAESGTMVFYQDGTLESILKLRRGVKWHDGVEFTAHDLVFTYKVATDRDIPYEKASFMRRISGVEALDDYTLKVIWNRWDAEADVPDQQHWFPMPRHILEEVYNADKHRFINHPFWSAEFVGLGPYKLTKFVHGSHLELTANDDYPLGRPKIKNVIVRFFPDSNTLIAALLAGEVHTTLHGGRVEGGLSMSDGILLGTRWSGTGDGKVIFSPYRLMLLGVQQAQEFQRPAALGDLPVRQALLHAIDRQAIVDRLFSGFTEVGHGWLHPQDPDYASFADAITRYEYDPARSQRLLTDVGWQRGVDGTLTNARGDRLDLEYRALGRDEESVATIVADYWKQVGIDSQLVFVSGARARDHEWMAKYPAIRTHSMVAAPVGGGYLRYACARVPSPRDRWVEQGNAAGYCSPQMEVALEEIEKAFPFEARMLPFKEMMRIALKDLPYLPLYFESEVVAVRSNVVGINRVPPKIRGRLAMHSYTWDMR
jgi:peptide/nickel transport system substrate-binding protein